MCIPPMSYLLVIILLRQEVVAMLFSACLVLKCIWLWTRAHNVFGAEATVGVACQVATFETVRQKFGPAAVHTNLHDRLADVLLVATALSGESPGECCRYKSMYAPLSIWSGILSLTR